MFQLVVVGCDPEGQGAQMHTAAAGAGCGEEGVASLLLLAALGWLPTLSRRFLPGVSGLHTSAL